MAEATYIGKLLYGRYRVLHHMGRGGSARVYAAHDVLMDRQVALKILSDDETDLRLNARSYETEVRAIAMLTHKNIVTVYDVSVEGNVKYIVMELVEGVTLRELLDYKKGPMPIDEVVAGTRQILDALQAAHEKGIVHRDIKPQNIMVMQSGLIKVADFGIARLPDSDRFRIKGRAVGTVHYISPEQATSKSVDGRSDLYSLGIVMYEMLTGKLPFDGEDASRVASRQVREAPVAPHLLREDISPALEAVVLRAMEKAPEDRYESAAAMRRALDRAVKGGSEVRRGGLLAGIWGKTDKKTTSNTTEEDHMNVILNRDKLNKKRNFNKQSEDLSAETMDAEQLAQEASSVEGDTTIVESTVLAPESMFQEPETAASEVDQVTKILDELSAEDSFEEPAIENESTDEIVEDNMLEDESTDETVEDDMIDDEHSGDIVEETIVRDKAEEADYTGIMAVTAEEEQAVLTQEEAPDCEDAAEEKTAIFGMCDASMDTSFYKNTAEMDIYEEIEDISHTGETDAEESAGGSTVAFGNVSEEEPMHVPLYRREDVEEEPEEPIKARKSKGACVTASVLGVVLAATVALSAWYTGFPFGTKIPDMNSYHGDDTIAGLPVYVDYVDSEEPAGTVLAQSPAAGYVRRADALYLRVSSGTSPYAAPRVKADMDQNMIGKSAAAAIAYLEELAARNLDLPLRFMRVLENSSEVPAGRVIGYDVTYTPADVRYTTVILYVSAGADN